MMWCACVPWEVNCEFSGSSEQCEENICAFDFLAVVTHNKCPRVQGVSLDIKPGEVVALVDNRLGKTTLSE